MTIEQSKMSELEELKKFLDSSLPHDKHTLIQMWINETIEYTDLGIGILKKSSDSETTNNSDIIKRFCSTPLAEINNGDLVNRFQCNYSEIDRVNTTQNTILTEIKEEPLSSQLTDSGLDETYKWENRHDVKTEGSSLPSYAKTSHPMVSLDRKDWLMDYMKLHAKNSKNQSAVINRDCIIIKVTPPRFASQSSCNTKLNFLSYLQEGYKNNLKACEKI